MLRVFVLSALLTAAGGTALAGALPDPPQVRERITYRRADLQTPAGAQRVARQIRWAARSVCGDNDPVLRLAAGFQACQAEAIARALSGLDAPMVAEALGVAPGPAVASR